MTGPAASAPWRRLLSGALAAGMLLAGAAGAMAQSDIIIVSRERLLDQATAARQLSEAQAALTERLQARINTTRAALAKEEAALARQRGELPEAEFESRAADFDHRVRQARRIAQERANAIQNAFRDAREKIAAALPGLIEKLRAETGASIVLDADQVLAHDAAIDMTDRAIALFNAEGPAPPVPEIDFSGPLVTPSDTGTSPAPAEDQPKPAPPAEDQPEPSSPAQ